MNRLLERQFCEDALSYDGCADMQSELVRHILRKRVTNPPTERPVNAHGVQ